MRLQRQQAEEEEIKKLTFKPELPSLQSLGLRDSREMFTQPKGIENVCKRIEEGRKMREKLR